MSRAVVRRTDGQVDWRIDGQTQTEKVITKGLLHFQCKALIMFIMYTLQKIPITVAAPIFNQC